MPGNCHNILNSSLHSSTTSSVFGTFWHLTRTPVCKVCSAHMMYVYPLIVRYGLIYNFNCNRSCFCSRKQERLGRNTVRCDGCLHVDKVSESIKSITVYKVPGWGRGIAVDDSIWRLHFHCAWLSSSIALNRLVDADSLTISDVLYPNTSW